MNFKGIILFIVSLVFFTSCSWQEYFMISNRSSSPITIAYSLKEPTSGFTIFNRIPMAYALNSSGDINWEKPLSIVDSDTAQLSVRVVIPANSSLIFGQLSNDHYTSYNQYFINSRHFNLKQIRMINHGIITDIIPQTFDTFFKKDKGEVKCVVD